MSDSTTNIKIAEISRKQQPSKFKEGETYTITNFKDEISGRKGSTMGSWSDGWKIGDTVEIIWEQREYTANGTKQIGWNAKNPVAKKPWSGAAPSYSSPAASAGPSIVDAFTIAAILLAPQFAGKKINVDQLEELATSIKSKLDAAVPAPAATQASVQAAPVEKTIDVTKETTPAIAVEETEEDEDKPF